MPPGETRIELTTLDGELLGPSATWSDSRRRILGRAQDSDVVLSASGVSKHHAAIERQPDASYYLSDLGSSNGTWRNGLEVEAPVPLAHGDEVRMGMVTIRIRLVETASAGPSSFEIVTGKTGRTISRDHIVLGRSSRADLTLRHPDVSRSHAVLRREPAGFRVEDLQSRNGTYLNGRRIVSQFLADGDRLSLTSPSRLPEAGHIEIRLQPDRCRLLVRPPAGGVEETYESGGHDVQALLRGAAGDSGPTTETTAEVLLEPSARPEAGEAPAPGEAKAPTTTASLVIRGMGKDRAKYRSGRWVPTSDLRPDPARRWANLAVLVAVPALALGLLAAGESRLLNPGPLSAPHRDSRFLEAQLPGPPSPCAPCHSPFAFGGVPNRACEACHDGILLRPPHDPETLRQAGHEALRCAGCHTEHHAGDPRPGRKLEVTAPEDVPHPPPALPVPREACLACHAGAHRREALPHAEPGQVFLNVFLSSTWIHSVHRDRPRCEACHRTQADRAAGTVTTQCEFCHGGREGTRDAECLTCHRVHRRGSPLYW